jgi:hypothetical protein
MGSTGDINFQHIGLYGQGMGLLLFRPDGVVWQHRTRTAEVEISGEQIAKAEWSVFANRGYLRIYNNVRARQSAGCMQAKRLCGCVYACEQ